MTGASFSDHGFVILEYLPTYTSLMSMTVFSPCGQQGRSGPTSAMCDQYYTSARDPNGWYNSVTNGIQRLVTPKVR